KYATSLSPSSAIKVPLLKPSRRHKGRQRSSQAMRVSLMVKALFQDSLIPCCFMTQTMKDAPIRPNELWATLNKPKNVKGRREKSLSSRKSHDTDYCIMKEGMSIIRGRKSVPGMNNGVHGVHDEKRVWFEVELQGAQGDREADVFQVSNDDTVVTQRRLKDKQPEEKTNTDCLSGLSKVFLERGYNQVYISSAIGFKKPIYMLGGFGWLASIMQGMFEPVKVKCTFLGHHKSIVGNKLWSSGVGTGSMQMLHGFEFEVEPQGDHTFEVEPQENVDQGASLQEVQTQDLMDYQLARDREQHIACELFGYIEDSNKAAFAVDAVEKIYAHGSLTFNNTVACEVISKWKAGLKDCNTFKMGRSGIMSGSVTS
nr:zinc finger, CCHC-type [Tanacetum cinerariifolium]